MSFLVWNNQCVSIIGCSIPKSLSIIVPGYKQYNLTSHKLLCNICIFIVTIAQSYFV